MINNICIKKQKTIAFVLLSALFLYILLSFSKSVFTGDIKVFMAIANQVKYQDGNVLQQLYESWDMKGIYHCGLIYIIYKTVNLISNAYQADKSLFQYLAKAIYMCMTVGVCYISVYLMKKKYKLSAYSFVMLTIIFSILLLGFGLPIHLQAEMSIMTILFFSFILFIYHQLRTDFLCGFLAIAVYGINVWLSFKNQSSFDFNNVSVYYLIFLILVFVVIFSFLDKQSKHAYYKGFLVFSLSGLFLFTYLNFNGYHSSYMIRQRELEEVANGQVKDLLNYYPEIEQGEETLFLYSGVSPFYIDNLPLQRYRDSSQGIWKSHEEELEKLMNYQGKFIILSPWFILKDYPEFKEKIENEHHAFSESLTLHSADWSILKLTKIENVRTNSVINEANSYLSNLEEEK